MSTSSTVQNLALALTLPHIHAPKKRVEYLAEQTVIAMLDTYGPEVARRFAREAAGTLTSPGFAEGLRSILVARGIPADALDIVLGALRAGASAIVGEPESVSTRAVPRVPIGRFSRNDDTERLFPGSIKAVPSGDALGVSQVCSAFAADPLTPIPDKMTHKVMEDEPYPGVQSIRVVAVIPTKEGIDMTLDTALPAAFCPKRHLALSPADLISMPDDMLGKTFAIDSEHGIVISVGRVDKTGGIQAIVSAIYRPVADTGASVEPPAAEAVAAPEEKPAASPRKRRAKADVSVAKKPRRSR